MKLVAKCQECFHELDVYASINGNSMEFLVFPCPHCHPAKVEKVTPVKGEWVEVQDNSYIDGAYDTRKASGRRSEDGRPEVYNSDGKHAFPYHQWRYPGETEWRD